MLYYQMIRMSSMNEETNEKKHIEWTKPLSPRLDGEVTPESRDIMKAIGILLPVLIYMLYVSLLTQIGNGLLNRIAESSEDNARYISANKAVISAYIRTGVITIATIAQIPALRGEKPVIISNDGNLARYIRCILLGISSSLFFNVLLSLTGFTGSSDSYEKIAEKQFALPLSLGIILYGLVAPIAEEVVFRGLVYNRLRRNGLNTMIAILISSLFFGLYHFNVVQAVYGTLMGLLIVWIYERYGGFIYPVIIHVSANIVIYIISSTGLLGKIMTPVTVIATGAVTAFLITSVARENKS